jgi:FtsZ-binding cell division protein ZapB
MSLERFFRLLRDVQKSIDAVDQTIDTIKGFEQHAYQSHSDAQSKIQSIERAAHALDDQYEQTQAVIGNALSLLETIRTARIAAPPASRVPSSDGLPSVPEVRQQLADFFTSEAKRKSAPLPKHAGCYAGFASKVAPGQFVCARLRHSYVLMVVWRSDGDDYFLYNPADLREGVRLIALPREEWTPLPTIIAEKPLKRWEHAKWNTVLSLRPDGDVWTTEFFQATVALQPCERPDETPRGYRLTFEDRDIIVPEKFVALFPDNWRSDL